MVAGVAVSLALGTALLQLDGGRIGGALASLSASALATSGAGLYASSVAAAIASACGAVVAPLCAAAAQPWAQHTGPLAQLLENVARLLGL